METALYIILPILVALYLTNHRPVWEPVKKAVIDPLHRFGHILFGLPSGKVTKITPREGAPDAHDLSIQAKGPRTIALLMGAPLPVVVGVAIVRLSTLLETGVLSALVFLLGAILVAGGLNGLLNLSVFTSRGAVTDAFLLEQTNKVAASKWVTISWVVTIALSVLVILAIPA